MSIDLYVVSICLIDLLNSGTIMTISKDRVKPSPHPDSWKLPEIFITGIVYGDYLAVTTVVFFFAMTSTDFFSVSVVSIHAMSNPSKLNNLWAWFMLFYRQYMLNVLVCF